MKDYEKNIETSYLKYWDINNSYGWAMSQKLPANNFKWAKDISEFDEDLLKSYKYENDEGHFLEADVKYPETLDEVHNDLPFLPERIKIGKVGNLITSLHDKTKYVAYIRNLKQALHYGFVLKKVHRINKFDPEVWFKLYINMNLNLRKKAKNDFKKDLMNNAVFGKAMENVRKYQDIKLVTTEARSNFLISEPNYQVTKYSSENKLVLLILELNKVVMYEF